MKEEGESRKVSLQARRDGRLNPGTKGREGERRIKGNGEWGMGSDGKQSGKGGNGIKSE